MHAASMHGTPSLTSHLKDAESVVLVAHPFSDRTQPCLTSVKPMELAGQLGHSPRIYQVHVLNCTAFTQRKTTI